MRFILELLALLTSVHAGVVRVPRDTDLQYPVCRPSSRCSKENKSQSGYYYKVNGHELIIDFLAGSYFTLRCDSNNRNDFSMFPDDSEMPAMSWPVTVEIAKFNQCLIPRDTYYATLQAFNVTVTKTLKLELPTDSELTGHHLRGLQIVDLEISSVDSAKPLLASYDFLDEVPRLQTLKLTDVVPKPEALSRLPTSLEMLNIVNARLPAADRALRSLNNTRHWLERLNSLRSLHLVESGTILAEVPEEKLSLPQLSLLPNLVSLSMYYMPLEQERLTDWLKNSSNLKDLILKSCGLAILPISMFEGTQLTKITLANNNLASLPQGLFTPLRSSLQTLDLSHNKLDKTALVYSVKHLKRLETLKASYNPLTSLCGDPNIIKTYLTSDLPATLRRLELKNTGATRICSDWVRNDALMDIDLSNNIISDLTYSDLEMNRTERGTVRVNLTNNTLSKIVVSRADYRLCLKQAASPTPSDASVIARVGVELKLQRNKLTCGCDAYWLREVLRYCPLLRLQSDVNCLLEPDSLHTTLLQYRPDEISCPYGGYCLPECSCVKRPRDNATVVQCSGALPPTPHWPPSARDFPLALHVANGTLAAVPNATLVELHAPNNNITEVADGDITDSLRVLDVRNNNISHISQFAAQILGSNENPLVYLSGNHLACECNDAPAFSFLKPVVRDWNSTQCVDMSLVLGKTQRDLCPSSLPLVFGIVVPVLVIVVAGLTVHLLMQRVKQFMFRHHMFVDWILRDRDDVDDPEITDDVFLSYSQADFKQLKELKAGLEKLGYSTIEHQNDWQPGDGILEQIAKSVLRARRTLLLVTDNFAESEWTPTEFRVAHQHALKTRTKRVLIVRCGLKKPQKLPLDLQVYINTHTYLDWDAPKFWHLLSRFMPPPRKESVLGPENLDPPSPLMQQNVPLLEKFPPKPQLYPSLSVSVPSAC